jgi:hypothetical protein
MAMALYIYNFASVEFRWQDSKPSNEVDNPLRLLVGFQLTRGTA